jgi:hypothetical protein
MAIVTQIEFIDWKSNPVTKAFFEAAKIRIEESKEMLSYSAGLDSMQDRFLAGLIQAYRELQDFRIEDINDD